MSCWELREMYAAFTEVKLGNSEKTVFTEPKMLANSDEEFLFLLGNKGVLGFVVWILEQQNFQDLSVGLIETILGLQENTSRTVGISIMEGELG